LGTFELTVIATGLPTVQLDLEDLPEHPWLPHRHALRELSAMEPGSIVALRSPAGDDLGMATWNPASHTPLRLLDRATHAVDTAWFSRRFQECLDARAGFVEQGEAYRWVYGEADLLPGLVIDRYGSAAAVQVRSQAMERLKPMWLAALAAIGLDLVVERSDFPGRQAEGLQLAKGVLFGEGSTRRLIKRGGLNFEVDLMAGPKTGFYLDQRQTSLWLQQHVRPGDRVADLFCSGGQLAVAAAAAGGTVVALDIEPGMEDVVARNAELNKVSVGFASGNAFDWLAAEGPEAWDWIIVDPPAIAKHRGQRRALLGAIYKLVRLSVTKLNPGGHLIACSCSHQVSAIEFEKTCLDAIHDARRRHKLHHSWGQPDDHPCPTWFPQGRYLNVADFFLE